MTTSEMAFLFYIFVCSHCGVPLQAGWYTKANTLTAISNIRKWLDKEARDKVLLENGNKALRDYVQPLCDMLADSAVEVATESDGECSDA